jgi:hypothetical protein
MSNFTNEQAQGILVAQLRSHGLRLCKNGGALAVTNDKTGADSFFRSVVTIGDAQKVLKEYLTLTTKEE